MAYKIFIIVANDEGRYIYMTIYLFLFMFVFGVILIYAAVLSIAVLALLRRFGFANKGKKSFLDKRSLRYSLIALSVIITACIAEGFFVEPYRIGVSEHFVSSDKIPEGGKIRIVHLSDFHIEAETSREKDLPDIVNSLEPDIIVLTGDFLNSDGGNPALLRLLSRLRAAHGMYAVYGNFKAIYNPAETLRKSGVFVLDDDAPNVENRRRADITIRGIPVSIFGFHGYDEAEIGSEAARIDHSRLNIVLFHKPDYIEDVADTGFDIYLCGHTHGGQVRLPFYGALVTLARHGKKYEMGEYRVGDTFMYVTRGVGVEGGNAPRVRFLCPPEVAVIDVVR